MPENTAASPASQTLSRGIRILEVLADARGPLTIDEIASRLGVHRSIAYRLLRTIEQQAPKIMEEHHAKGVEFHVVVKDNQVVLRAKPKTLSMMPFTRVTCCRTISSILRSITERSRDSSSSCVE